MAFRTQNEAYAQKGVFRLRVVATRGEEQADDTLVDGGSSRRDAGTGGKARASPAIAGMKLDQPAPRIGIPALGRDNESLFLRRREPFGVVHRDPRVTP